MALAAQKYSSDPRIRQIRAQQKQIEKCIGKLVFEIDRINSGQMGDFWAIKAETREFTTYKTILEERLRTLRRQLRSLRRQRQELRLAVIQNNARRIRKKNRLAARRLLRKASKRGSMSKDEEEKLVRYTEASLRASLVALEDRASRANMKRVLVSLGDVMAAGGTDEAVQNAFGQLGAAAAKRLQRADKRFRNEDSPANLKRVLVAVGVCQLFGDENEGWPPMPEGLNIPWPEQRHQVQPGETLRSIAKHYYGSPVYWDQIYLANAGLMSNNIHAPLRPHIVLIIPGYRR